MANLFYTGPAQAPRADGSPLPSKRPLALPTKDKLFCEDKAVDKETFSYQDLVHTEL